MICTFLISCVLICCCEAQYFIHVLIHLVLLGDWDVGLMSWFVHASQPTRHQWHWHPTGLTTPYIYNTSGVTRWYVTTGFNNMSGVTRWYVPDWYVWLEQYAWHDKMISTLLVSCVLICCGEARVSIHIHIHLVLSDDWDVEVMSWFVHASEPTRHQWHGHPTGLTTPYTYNTSGVTRWYVLTGWLDCRNCDFFYDMEYFWLPFYTV